jgi:two-component system response regulator FixJ
MKDMSSKKQVFFLNGEANVHRTATAILEELGKEVEITCFDTGRECLEEIQRSKCDVLITELSLPDMDGCQLLTTARRIIPFLPIVGIAAEGSIADAVRAMKSGASDVIEKPIEANRFLSAVEEALTLADTAHSESLSKAEKQVLLLLLQGKSNKQIAHLLHRSVRTVEDHRRKVMHKLDVDNLVDLTKRAAVMGLLKLP